MVASMVISLFRGLTREVMALVGWGMAFWVALTYTAPLTQALEPHLEMVELRPIAAFSALFLSTLIIAAMVNFLVSKLVETTGLAGTDRLLGLVFGAARGAMLVAVLILLAGFTTLPKSEVWSEALLLANFQPLVEWMSGYIPPEYIENSHLKKG